MVVSKENTMKYEKLCNENGTLEEKEVCKMAKSRENKIRDLTNVRCTKGEDYKVLINGEKITRGGWNISGYN